jgi:sugar phosphate isomerase/epimerase
MARATATPPETRFRFALNTSTIRGQKLSIVDEARQAAAAGYEGIEPWVSELADHEKAGHTLADLGKLFRDLSLTVCDAIGFAEWAVDDDERRKKGLENLKRDMDMVARVGGKRIAAPPAGMTDRADADHAKLADRFRAVCEIGEREGVTPLAEVWGFSKTMTRLGQAAQVAIDGGHPNCGVLPDVYHIYKGGSDHRGLLLLQGKAVPVIHMNDYPKEPPRADIKDEHRVYPGDGTAPIVEVLRALRAIGSEGWLSLELFNRAYWAQDAATVLRTGVEKMKAVVAQCDSRG